MLKLIQNRVVVSYFLKNKQKFRSSTYALISSLNHKSTIFHNNITYPVTNMNSTLKHAVNSSFCTDLSESCWSCGKILKQEQNKLFCEHCNSIQKPNPKSTYFQILDEEEVFTLDESKLSQKYKNLQRVLHPDKFSNKSPLEQKISEEYSSLVNKAYFTLLQPLSRATYMLQLKGVQIPEKTQLESEFLHKIMELNEQVEEAETPEEILKLRQQNKEAMSELVRELATCLAIDDVNKAISVLIYLKYYVSIDTNIKGIIRDMGILE